jgi:hypothetical protein
MARRTSSVDIAGPVVEDAKTEKVKKELNSEEIMMLEAQELPVCQKSPAKSRKIALVHSKVPY